MFYDLHFIMVCLLVIMLPCIITARMYNASFCVCVFITRIVAVVTHVILIKFGESVHLTAGF